MEVDPASVPSSPAPSTAMAKVEPRYVLEPRAFVPSNEVRFLRDGDQAYPDMIAAIEGAGASIARIESRHATLEAAFLAMTGRALRDGQA